MTQTNSGKQGRFREIDALRGLAVLLMVFNHGLNWAYAGTAYNIVALFGTLSVGDIATPMFYLAAGLSLYYALHGRLRKDPDPLKLRSGYTVRLGKLFVIGIFLSMGWGVLQAQAVTLLAVTWLMITFMLHQPAEKFRSWLPALITVSLAAHFLITQFTLSPLLHSIFAGQFPLFAILAINALGFYIAPRLNVRTFALRYIGLGAVLIGAGLYYAERFSPMIRHGGSAAFLLFGIGFTALVLGVLRSPLLQNLKAFHYLTIIGRDTLFLYVFHYVAFFVPFYFSGYMLQLTSTGAVVFSSVMTILIGMTAYLRRNSRITVYDYLDMITLAGWGFVTRTLALRRPGYLNTSYNKNMYPRIY